MNQRDKASHGIAAIVWEVASRLEGLHRRETESAKLSGRKEDGRKQRGPLLHGERCGEEIRSV